jgi:hypothetical protein
MPSSVGHVPDFFLFCLYTYSQMPIASKPTWTKNHGEIDKKNPLRLVLILISNSILVISLYFDFFLLVFIFVQAQDYPLSYMIIMKNYPDSIKFSIDISIEIFTYKGILIFHYAFKIKKIYFCLSI